jgi:para-nitrobenzyl esterase
LRKLDAGKLMGSYLIPRPEGFLPKLYPLMPWGPAIDGSVSGLKAVPLQLIRGGNWAKVPLNMGTNKDEGSIFIVAAPIIVPDTFFPLSERHLNTTLNYFFNNNKTTVDNINRIYKKADYKTPDIKGAAILRDYFFACASRRLLNAARLTGQPNTRLYHFTYKGDFIEDIFLGDYHSAELEFVFDNEWPPIIHIFTERDKIMADAFGSYWSRFVYNLDPNVGNTTSKFVPWPVYDTTKTNVVMDVPPRVENDLYGAQCTYWDTLAN